MKVPPMTGRVIDGILLSPQDSFLGAMVVVMRSLRDSLFSFPLEVSFRGRVS